MLVDSVDSNKFIAEKHLRRIYELSLKSIETLRDIPELEEPTEEQQEWIKGKRFHK